MSIRVQELIWKKAPYDNPYFMMVMLALADWSTESGISNPSVEKLAAKARQSKRNVQYALRQFEIDGYLTIVGQFGRGQTGTFQLNLEALKGCKSRYEEREKKGANGDTLNSQKGANQDVLEKGANQEGCKSEHERVQIAIEKGANDGRAYKEEPSENRHEPSVKKKEVGSGKRPPPASASDEDWISGLEQKPIYAGLDIRRVLGKMQVWCEMSGKQPTRRRLINWLNREDRPMQVSNGNGGNGNGHRYKSSVERASDNLDAILRDQAERREARANRESGNGVGLSGRLPYDADAEIVEDDRCSMGSRAGPDPYD